MHISEWSIKNPVAVIVTFLTLAIVGFASFLSLGIDNTPNIDVPSVTITVTQRGAGPEELESEVTKKIEDAIANIGNIDQLTSTVTDGSSVTTVNFVLGTNSDRATNDVRNAIDQIRQDLPQEIDDPIVRRVQFAGGSVMTYAVSSERRSVEALSDIVDRTISRELLSVTGVAQIDRLGGLDREVRVNLDPSRLQAYGITATQVNDQIREFNINLPGGRAEFGGGEQNVRTLGSAKTVEELQRYRIVLPSGDSVLLSSLGTVKDDRADARQSAFLNGKAVVAFSVRRTTGSTLVSVEEAVREKLEELQKTLPQDLKFDLIFTRADAIRASYRDMINDLVFGCLLTVITIGLFLWNARVTIITALSLPISIVATFGIMKVFGYTLNSMTLLALALAIGNLIDDAVCMVEIIDQHLLMGKKPLQAALDGAKELGLAVLATAATIIAVFVPVAFMGGVPGQFFQPFGVTIAISTIFSTLVACTLTPMLAAYILTPKKASQLRNSQNEGNRIRPYRSILTWALRHRITTMIIAIAFFIASVQLIPFIPKGLFNSGDTGLSTISVELPPGSQLQETEAVAQEIYRSLKDKPEVENVLAAIGSNSNTSTNINSATIYVKLTPKEQRDVSQRQFQEEMRDVFAQIPGARVSFRALGGAGSNKDVNIVLKSENIPVLTATANALEREMRQVPGLVEIASSISLVKPEIVIVPERDRAADLGVSVQAIARTASLALLGDNDSNLAKFNLPDRQIPIRVQIDPKRRDDIETLKNLRVPSNDGTLVPLNAVANIRLGSGPAEIKRFDRNRQVEVTANLQGLSLGQAIAKVRTLDALNPLPPEVTEEPAGDAKIMSDIFSRFLSALGLSILAIYAILVLLYNNFLYPFGILVSLPFSIGGTFLALLITQKELGLYALIGIVLLVGLVIKNAILLVDFALIEIKAGKSLFQGVIDASISRLRPILMTSLSTVAGMLPIALGLGADGEVRSPMATAAIGGFTTSTLLTLVVVPVIFTYIYNFSRWLQKNLFGTKTRSQKQFSPTEDLGK
jgi:hydrophobe/amphiphile efflux-1 (HAE1) family protein